MDLFLCQLSFCWYQVLDVQGFGHGLLLRGSRQAPGPDLDNDMPLHAHKSSSTLASDLPSSLTGISCEFYTI